MVSRSKSQLNKHCIKTENILKTKTSIMQASGGSGAPRRQRSMSIALPNEDEDTDTRGCQIQAASRHRMIIGQTLNMAGKTCQYMERAGGGKRLCCNIL